MYSDLLYEYETVLLGKKSTFSNYFFCENDTKNEDKALYVIKFAIETYLKWSPKQAITYLSWDIIKLLKLDLITKYIDFPPEMDSKDDMYILTGKLYPHLVKVNSKEITLKVYKRVLEKDLYKFPKEYLSGDQEGRNRAIICFQYMFEQFAKHQFANAQEAYKFFASANGPKLLKKYRLNVASVSMFEHPVDFLHTALPPEARDEFWYKYYKFKLCNNEQIRELKKKNEFIA